MLADFAAGGIGTLGGGSGCGGLGGFSSKKDRARHEAKHNPKILCEWIGEGGERCGRKFSRVDNMKDHVRRIHRKGQAGNAKATPGLVAANEEGAMVHERAHVDLGAGPGVGALQSLNEEQWARGNGLDNVDVEVNLDIHRPMALRTS